jgi:universal stress protein E
MSKTVRLLVAYDGLKTDEELPQAIAEVAQHLSAEVALFHAVEVVPTSRWRSHRVSSEDLQRLLVDDCRRRLAERAHSLQGISTKLVLRAGDPSTEIVNAAIEHQCDMIVLLERSATREHGFGATTNKLLRKSPIPVWAVRGSGQGYPRRILAAVDVASDDPQTRLLNDQILEIAVAFTRRSDTSLWLLHAWNLWGERLLSGIGGEAPERVAELVSEEERTHRRDIERLLQRHDTGGVDLQVELIRGDAVYVIPSAVERLGIDLLIMGTLSRTGLPGLVIGNTAERVLNRVACSVLAVKPQGFVSPLVAAMEGKS